MCSFSILLTFFGTLQVLTSQFGWVVLLHFRPSELQAMGLKYLDVPKNFSRDTCSYRDAIWNWPVWCSDTAATRDPCSRIPGQRLIACYLLLQGTAPADKWPPEHEFVLRWISLILSTVGGEQGLAHDFLDHLAAASSVLASHSPSCTPKIPPMFKYLIKP